MNVLTTRLNDHPGANRAFLHQNAELPRGRVDLRVALGLSEKQFVAAQRDIVSLMFKNELMLDDDKYMLKADHAASLKKREEELMEEMRTQLFKMSC